MTTMTRKSPPEYMKEAANRLTCMHEAIRSLRSAQDMLRASISTWEAARNSSAAMHDTNSWEDYWQAYGDACRGSCSSGSSCSGGSCSSTKDPNQLPCTCSDDQYANVAATGSGYSDTCPYHTAWAKERRRKERGL